MTSKAIAFSQAALENMSDIAEYLVMENPKAAKAFRERLEQSCNLLADMEEVLLASLSIKVYLVTIKFI